MRFFRRVAVLGPIARGTARTTLILCLRLAMQAGTLVVLARVLGPTGFGTYAALGALAVLLGTLATFGTHLTLLRNVTRDPLSRDESLRLSLGTTAMCGAVLLCLYGLGAFWLRLSDVGGLAIACVGAAEVLLQPVFMIAATERQARGEIARSQLVLTLPLMFRLLAALTVGAAAPSHPLTAFATGYLLTMASALILVVARTPTRWPPPWRWRVARPSEWRDASGYALQGASASGVSELDKMLAGKLLLGNAAGVYAAAARVVSASVLPVVAMVISATPRLFRESTGSGRRLRRWLFMTGAIYGISAGLGLWLLSPWVEPLFGPSYAGLGEIVRVLAWAVPAITLRAIAANMLITVDRPWLRVGLELSGWLMMPTLAWVWVPGMGARGLALSVICAEWLMASASVATIWYFVRKADKSPD